LIERGKAPFGTAFFGGHIEAKESPETAFKRELKEELNIDKVDSLTLVGVHGNYGRDPRQHSVEVTYTATVSSNPKAGSDASAVTLYTIEDVKQKLIQKEAFAFDHGIILENYLNEIKGCNPCTKKCLYH
jgi:ADP-ribose pyrophosphatase YjhB (NUDIX family)